MKKLELKEMGVMEMNNTEMNNVNGGDGLTDLLGNVFKLLGSILGAVFGFVQSL